MLLTTDNAVSPTAHTFTLIKNWNEVCFIPATAQLNFILADSSFPSRREYEAELAYMYYLHA